MGQRGVFLFSIYNFKSVRRIITHTHNQQTPRQSNTTTERTELNLRTFNNNEYTFSAKPTAPAPSLMTFDLRTSAATSVDISGGRARRAARSIMAIVIYAPLWSGVGGLCGWGVVSECVGVCVSFRVCLDQNPNHARGQYN